MIAGLLMASLLAGADVEAQGVCSYRATDLVTRAERRCCFIHRAYAGVCIVEPAEDETCATILAYLNDPRSTGKTYCNGTQLRGGWKQVQCEEPAVVTHDSRLTTDDSRLLSDSRLPSS